MENLHGERLLLRPGEAAEALGLGRATVYALLLSGELRSVRIGRARRISVAALRDFVEAREFDAGSEPRHEVIIPRPVTLTESARE